MASQRERSRLGREEALWAEIIRCEVGSWRPSRLPARFRPSARRQHSPLWAGLPLALAASLLLLTVVTFANLSDNVTVVLSNLAAMRLPAAAGSAAGTPPASRHGQAPALGTGRTERSAGSSQVTSDPSARISRVGTASEPRTTASSPSVGGPAPLPSPPPPPTAVPAAPNVPPLSTPYVPSDPQGGFSAGQPLGGALIAVPSPG